MKKIQIIILMFIITAYSYAQSFEYSIFVPIGASFGINYYSLKSDATNKSTIESFEKLADQNKKDTGLGFDTGVYVHLGNRFKINKNTSFSLMWEVGYSHDAISFSKLADKNNYYITSTAFESIILGIYPKFNWDKFTFGLAGGIKFPLAATSMDSSFDYENNIEHRNTEFMNVVQIFNTFEVPIIPYLKFSVDYTILSDKNLELMLGGYVGYDFGMKLKNTDYSELGMREYVDQTISSVDIGFQVGIKILNNNRK